MKESFYNFLRIFSGMQILQLSVALPKSEYSTEELMDIFPCQIREGVRKNVFNLGVSRRHLLIHTVSPSKAETVLSEAGLVELCTEACENAIGSADLSVRDIGYFVVAYDVNPFLCPGLSQLLIRKLGFNPYVKHVNVQGMACAAFTSALELAENHLAANSEDLVLLCVSGVNSYWFQNQVRGIKDVMEISQINSMKDEARRRMELRKWIAAMEFFLFGDGVASAIVARKGNGLAVNKIVEVTNLRNRDYLAGYARLAALNEPFKFGFHSHLDKEIPKLGVEYTGLALRKLLGKNAGDIAESAKKWAVHTGSEKILNLIAKHYGIQPEKISESREVLREYGNLAGASLPFILHKIVSESRLTKGDVVLMLGYGWGFSASAALLKF
jgi:predicted naringenin-chalcone synthase